MDRYKPLLKRLGCVGFHEVEALSEGAVFRAAFILETVQVRLSSKTQKKFAILNVSDGYQSFELPLWSDLFEEKSHLLKENQLLFAVLQVDTKDEGVQLRCRWFDDLTLADESMVAASDQAYDKAKMQTQRFSREPKRAKVSEPPKPASPELFQISLDVDKHTHRHVLRLKEIFEKHRGSTPVCLTFMQNEAPLATIHIEAMWGVSLSNKLAEEIKNHI